jgi:peroxiredoxin
MKWMLRLALPALAIALVGVIGLAQDDATKEKPTEKPKADEVKKDEAKPEAKEEAEPEKATVGKKAPDFTLKNADGKEVKLSDYAGKVVVIEWINLDCPWCKKHYEEGDDLVKQQKKLREDGGEWLLICSSAEGKQGNFDAETLKKRLDQVSLKGDVYLHDADGTVGKKYEAKTTPHCYVIDKKGVLRYAGALDNLNKRKAEPVNYVAKALEAIAADKEIAEKEVKPYG